MQWILVILILSGPDKGNVVDLAAFTNPPQCQATARELNRKNSEDDDYEGPNIRFACIKAEGTY